MPFLPTKRHTISSAGDLSNKSPSNSPSPVPAIPRRADNVYSARGAHFAFDDTPNRELHQDKQTYDALVGNRDRPVTPGGTNRQSVAGAQRSETKSPSQLYEEQYRPRLSKTFRPPRQTPIVAYLRTNVIVKDEYSLVTDLSQHFSVRYSKPPAAIMITVDHSTCLLLGATFEPAYVLSISALQSELQPESNRQNVAYIQSFMSSILGVSPERGIIRFEAINEENLAMNGTTMGSTMNGGQRAQRMRTTMGTYGMPPDVARSFVQQSPRNSFGGRPMAILEPVVDAEPGSDPRDSTMQFNQDKRWLPIEEFIPGHKQPSELEATRDGQSSPSPAQRPTPSPPPVTEKSPLRNPLASNPPDHRISMSPTLPNAPNGHAPSRSTDWCPVMPAQNGIAARLDSSMSLREALASDTRQDKPERRSAKLVKRQSLSRPSSRPTSSYTVKTSKDSPSPPSGANRNSRPLSYIETDAIPPSVPSRASPSKKQSRRVSGLLHAFLGR